ncbi:NAD(P)H-binding protein, PF13460 family [Bordetella bronchiseptica MBORD681]|uniref:complex I NDUFA9 subunit family protein n=1 Tax=Bordetella bronchiseptica TaxID=518 RepID=UPI00046185B2|nr:complex I NDUFA9 subunit family protein [Bordetella bronchiseptica]KDD00579.1 NAD(P)H-binding protein, PF13460 family [Bordetella bronchiseptica MBORD698]KDD06179.1 NAD(P)H-binding protein, PF13460 family [Bordetella bronchiseptica MBORD681]
MRILVIGGTGFIGRHLVARLAAQEHKVLVPTRRYNKGRDLQVLPTVTLIEADVHDDAELDRLMHRCDAVVNLVGVLHGSRGRPYGAGFARAHVLLPERIAQACVRNGVARMLHVSALGADSGGPSMYLRSKGEGEAAIQRVFGATGGWTLFRPSVVFGPDDNFTRMFARLARLFPVLPLAGARSRMQPVYVGDVADAMMAALANGHTAGKIYELCGPQVYTLGEIVRLCALWSGHPRPVCEMPMALGRMQALLFECLPGDPLVSRDNLDSLTRDNVASGAAPSGLAAPPAALEAVAPAYLARR